MWLSQNSATVEAVLIEIETPRKRWFKKSGDPTADFTHAQNQLLEWKAWFDEPEHRALFKRMYHVPQDPISQRSFQVHYVLIYGSSRAGLGGRPEDNLKRGTMQRASETYMTFDRLSPRLDTVGLQFMTVKLRKGRYEAVAIPPTLTLGPAFAADRAEVTGKEAAAERCTWASAERRAFLAKRFVYWDAWVRSESERIRIYSPGDAE